MSLDLIAPAKEILDKVKQTTAKEIQFVEKDDLTTSAALKMARKDMPSHLICPVNLHCLAKLYAISSISYS